MTVAPGTAIWASLIEPGTIIDAGGVSFAVVDIHEGYDTFTFSDGVRLFVVEYGDLVTVLGYFNP